MSKNEFLQELAIDLIGLPQDDVERWLEYYTEMLDDRIEDGMSEEEAVASLGDPAKIVREILAQTPFTKLIKNKITPKRKLRVWEIVLICLGSPIWLSLAVSAVAIVLSVFASLWAVIVSLWAVELSLAVSGLGGVLMTFFFVGTGATHQGFLILGGGLICAGLAYFGFFLCKWITRYFLKLCELFLLFVKSLFVEKEGK